MSDPRWKHRPDGRGRCFDCAKPWGNYPSCTQGIRNEIDRLTETLRRVCPCSDAIEPLDYDGDWLCPDCGKTFGATSAWGLSMAGLRAMQRQNEECRRDQECDECNGTQVDPSGVGHCWGCG